MPMWLFIPFLFIAVLGTVNGANLTDGLDGLATSVTVIIAVFFTAVAAGTKSGLEPISAAFVGALLGFFLYNVYPARVFMGDTGSLALGGFVSSMAFMLKMPIFIVIVACIYLLESLSDIIQVSWFKYTKKNMVKEEECLKWHRFIIIFRKAVMQKLRLWQLLQLLQQCYV